ncbi:MAG: hypothetical protein U1E29_17115 [Coriobacteriia bacterium]|nr:hypothetical protein [Coriobacteriia bacterium]
MDYLGMVKRAWEITWRYRVLWLFGFLVGGSGVSGNSNMSGYTTNSSEMTAEQSAQFDQAFSWVADNVALIVGITAMLVLVGICFWVISIAAQGGLIHLSSQADEGIAPTVREGFTVGFHSWGRVFLIGFALYAPFAFMIALIVTPTVVLPIAAAIRAGDAGSIGALVAVLLGMAGVLIVEIILFAIVGVALGMIEMLALRHGVLDGLPAIQSIKTAFHDLRTRFLDVFLMWLVTLGVGLVVGILFGVVAAMFAVLIVGTAIAGLGQLAVAIGFVMVLLFIVPGAIATAYYSTLWTVFYRRFTGRDGAITTTATSPADAAAHGFDVPPAPAGPSTDFLPPPPSPPGE